MTNATCRLSRACDKLFVDLDALNLVRFDGDGPDATAHLKFKDGSSEALQGEIACELQRYLQVLKTTDEGATTAVGQGESTETEQSPSGPLHTTTAPMLGRNKAWFYRKDKNGKGLIMAFVNAKGSCSVRPFDAETGFALGKRYVSGYYQEKFADLLEGAAELTVDSQPSLERDCKQRLPEQTFAHLRRQVEQIG